MQTTAAKTQIKLVNPHNGKLLTQKGEEWVDDAGNTFKVRNGVMRIAKEDNYTENFGFQWNKFQKVQIDQEQQELPISKVRFFAETAWKPEELKGKNILEVGAGAGRFTQVVLANTEANIYSVDLSSAVEANYRNNSHYGDRLQIFQASVYEMPFEDNAFDKVFCLGVLQHTPDFEKSIQTLCAKVKPGGELVVDFYPITGWWTKIHAKYIFRPYTKKMDNEKLLSWIDKNVDWMMKLYNFNHAIGLGKLLNRFIPIPDIKATIPDNLSKKELRDWVVLDTFDMFSPEYDQPQTLKTVKKWVENSGLEVTLADFIFYDNARAAVVRAIKK
ncbi:MAG: class I SAM-dependent methyltransferase [Flavipsychrobacter sp.]|nr:class I SAM-dependent methyltransferase [Flavipsychrobacter sp.]